MVHSLFIYLFLIKEPFFHGFCVAEILNSELKLFQPKYSQLLSNLLAFVSYSVLFNFFFFPNFWSLYIRESFLFLKYIRLLQPKILKRIYYDENCQLKTLKQSYRDIKPAKRYLIKMTQS